MPATPIRPGSPSVACACGFPRVPSDDGNKELPGASVQAPSGNLGRRLGDDAAEDEPGPVHGATDALDKTQGNLVAAEGLDSHPRAGRGRSQTPQLDLARGGRRADPVEFLATGSTGWVAAISWTDGPNFTRAPIVTNAQSRMMHPKLRYVAAPMRMLVP